MTYNLTYYRQTTSFCNGTNNDANEKDKNLKKICDYVKPDILMCNEIGENFANANRILTNALNTDGITSWKQCDYSNNSFSSLVNMLFYNSNKFELADQAAISKTLNGGNIVRVIDHYKLYYKDPNLAPGSDTVFLHFFLAHLKAGGSSSDQSQRDLATEAVMDYITTNDIDGNVFFAGDLNVSDAAEASIQNLINPTNSNYAFVDPVDELGNWGNNSSYRYYHSQSTRVSNDNNGCFVLGGMDDRYDLIFTTDEVMNYSNGVEYISNSYRAIGNDGNRFNGSVIFPQNFSVPSGIDTALYEMSDHLPVKLDLKIKKLPVSISENEKSITASFTFQNPVKQELVISLSGLPNKHVTLRIMNNNGQQVAKRKINGSKGQQLVKWDVSQLSSGIYYVLLQPENGKSLHQKLIIQ